MLKRGTTQAIRSRLIATLFVIVVVGTLPSSHANIGDDELIVECRRGDCGAAIAAQYGLEIISSINDHGRITYLMKNNSGDLLEEVIHALERDHRVLKVDPNHISTVVEINGLGQRVVEFVDGGCTQGVADQEVLARIRVPEAHGITRGGGVTVAVIDTGIDYGAGLNTMPSYDFLDRDDDPSDVAGGLASGHGTMVASLIQAVAPDAQIMPIRAFDQYGFTGAFQLAEAIHYARMHGADVINMSFSFDRRIEIVDEAIEKADRAGIVLVGASGNDGSFLARFPASDNDVISVTAVDEEDIKAPFANYGRTDVAAPGVRLEVTSLNGSCGLADGTSFSAALVSGEAALLIAAGHWNPARDIEKYGVRIDRIPENRGYHLDRRIDCYAALTRTDPDDDDHDH